MWADGSLDRCTLGLRLTNLTPDDALDVRVNGEAIPWRSGNVSFGGWSKTQLAPGRLRSIPHRDGRDDTTWRERGVRRWLSAPEAWGERD